MIENILSSLNFSLSSRINSNILVSGSSGVGKTVFSKSLLDYFPPEKLYSFVASKDDKSALSILSYPPLPRHSVSEFIDAFVSTLPDPNGWYSSQIPVILASLFSRCDRKEGDHNFTLNYFLRFLDAELVNASSLDRPVISFIVNRIHSLYSSASHSFGNDFSAYLKNKVFSFDGLVGFQKTFFYEFMLRLLWKKTHSFYLFLDEFHRISSFQNSIIGEMLREIRTKGGIIASTQNLADVLPGYINQFGSIFLGRSINVDDFAYWRFLSLPIVSSIISLKPFTFLDIISFIQDPGKSHIWKAVL